MGTVTRRDVLGGTAAATAGLLSGLWVVSPANAHPTGGGQPTLTIDIACLGSTLQVNMDAAARPDLTAPDVDTRGGSFYVEGLVYPEATIPDGEGFAPESAEAMGTWLCTGWFLFHQGRPLPHVVTTQEYLLDGGLLEGRTEVQHTLVSSGIEGGVPLAYRAVVGGTGRYRGARGEVVQHTTGSNTTVLNTFGEPAPNFRFEFAL